MNDRLKQELSLVISERVIEIFKTMFDVDVTLVGEKESDFDDDDLVSKFFMRQENLDIVLRFAFKRELREDLSERALRQLDDKFSVLKAYSL